MISPKEIENTILKALPGSNVIAQDTTGTSDHYHVVVVAPQFAGLNRVKQHQMVYAPLKEALKGALHAIQLETFTPDEWRDKG
jgi:acid stress-induced BolA-like protein IbaG/YrbA